MNNTKLHPKAQLILNDINHFYKEFKSNKDFLYFSHNFIKSCTSIQYYYQHYEAIYILINFIFDNKLTDDFIQQFGIIDLEPNEWKLIFKNKFNNINLELFYFLHKNNFLHHKLFINFVSKDIYFEASDIILEYIDKHPDIILGTPFLIGEYVHYFKKIDYSTTNCFHLFNLTNYLFLNFNRELSISFIEPYLEKYKILKNLENF